MIKYTRPLAFVLLLLVPLFVGAQDWRILSSRGNLEDLEQMISRLVEQNYVPVGIDVSQERGLTVLVTRSELLSSDGWRIYEASSPNEATAEFTDLMRAGYLLMDVSISDDNVVGLFSLSPGVVAGWRVVDSAPNFFDANALITRLQTEGFTAWGVSAAPDRIWHLVLNLTDAERYQTMLVGVPASPEEETVAAITGIVQEGWVPWGLSVRDEEYLIRVIRPAD